MKLYSVQDQKFGRYGQILQGYDYKELLETLEFNSPKPLDGFIYEASVPQLESLKIAADFRNRGFGGMPIQIGYCNGTNHKLNCLEYHRDSEISIMSDDVILILSTRDQMEDLRLDTTRTEAFFIPAGTGIELYATTLHYAPCDAHGKNGYRVVNILSRGTNDVKPMGLTNQGEDRLCFGKNKWLLAHEQSDEAKKGAFIGLKGKNIDLAEKDCFDY